MSFSQIFVFSILAGIASASSLDINTCFENADCKIRGEICFAMSAYGCQSGVCACPDGKVYDNFENKANCVDVKKPGQACSNNSDCGTAQLKCIGKICRCKPHLKEKLGFCVPRHLGDSCLGTCTPQGIDDPVIKRMSEVIYSTIQCTNSTCQCKNGFKSVEIKEVTAKLEDGRYSNTPFRYCFRNGVNVIRGKEGGKCFVSPHVSAQDAQVLDLCEKKYSCVKCPDMMKKHIEEDIPNFQKQKLEEMARKCGGDCMKTTNNCCKSGLEKLRVDIGKFTLSGLIGTCKENRGSVMNKASFTVIFIFWLARLFHQL